jgi:hypothetical protein
MIFSSRNITTDTTTTLKSAPGVLHSITINTPANSGSITVYDSLVGSGTKIATIASFASTNPCLIFDVAFWTGLTIVTATAAPDITVTFT